MDLKHIQIIGVKTYTKDGIASHIVDYMKPYSDYDIQSSDRCSGFTTGQFFTREKTAGDLNAGDVIRPYYAVGYKGAAVFDGYEMVKPAKEK